MKQASVKELARFIEQSPTSFHAVSEICSALLKEQFVRLNENEKWNLQAGGRYFVTRNDSSLIAFSIPPGNMKDFRIVAGHSDSPTFKIKENPELESGRRYIRLNVERYGGMLCAPWMDRPLSVAGRIVVKSGEEYLSKLVNIDRDLVLIPNLAIHMNREANEGYSYNIQKDMLPLYATLPSKTSLLNLIADAASVRETDILGHDLFLYNREKASIWGASGEFISSPRLDDLQCVFASLKGFTAAVSARQKKEDGPSRGHMPVLCVLDSEEVGSATIQGAASTFLYDTLTRIHDALGYSREEYRIHLAGSFMISADNAHAVHPNHVEKSDPANRPFLNGGIVLKFNAGQKYCTDGISAAMFRDVCRQADVPVQTFVNRSDMPGGSTLGNISTAQVPVNTADVGLPMLAMHSPYETAGIADTEYMIKATRQFFSH